MTVEKKKTKKDLLAEIEQLKRMEEELYASNQRLNALLQSLPVGVSFSSDKTCCRVSGNPALLAQFEITEADNISASAKRATNVGRKVRYFSKGRKLADNELPLQRAVALNCNIEPVELEVLLPSGRCWFAEASAAPLRNPQGDVVAGLAVTVDITKRKQAEKDIRRHNEILSGINRIFQTALACGSEEELGEACLSVAMSVTGSGTGFIGEIGEDGLLHDISIDESGWKLCAMRDRSGKRRLPVNFHLHGIYGRVLLDGKGMFTNDPKSHPDSIGLPEGHPPLTSFLGVPLFREGHLFGMIAVANRDGGYGTDEQETLEALAPAVVEAFMRKRSEEALQRERDLLQTVMNGAKNSHLVYLDRHFNFVRVNETYARTCGYRPEEMVGKNHFVLYPNPEIETIFKRVRDTGEPYEVRDKPFEFPDQPERGVTYWDWTLLPVKDAGGRVNGLVFSLIETTDRKRTEEELRLAKEAAEAATRVKSLFLANMSHELRTPMAGVLGMLGLALCGSLEPDQRECLTTADRSARALLQILNDILDLAKIEAGKLSMEEKPFKLRDCVVEACVLFLPEARRKGLNLKWSIANDLSETLIGDSLRLQQVLRNLIGNALKFTDRGKVAVRVSSGDETPDGRREFIFAVSDTGIGIPDDKKEVIFDPFRQADETHAREFGGTGLGLAISREIVERMGGAMNCKSEKGAGSIFTFNVYLRETDAEHKASNTFGTEFHNAGTISVDMDKDAPRLLVAEDDPVVRKALELMFGRRNFKPDFASNGIEAVEKWEKGEYDLIVMDVQMPRMDGFEATAAIREKEKSRGGHIPIVAMTAHAMKEDEERCIAAGMDAYISKPVDFQKCLEVIRGALKNDSGV